MTKQEEISEAMRLLKNKDILAWVRRNMYDHPALPTGFVYASKRRWQKRYRQAKAIGNWLSHHHSFGVFVISRRS